MCSGPGSPSTPPPQPPQAPPEGGAADLAPLILGSTKALNEKLSNNRYGKDALTIALGSLPSGTGLYLGGGK